MSKNLVVRFAGEGGQGVVGGSEILAAAAAAVGYHILTFSTFPSQIKGGPAWGQARISTNEILWDEIAFPTVEKTLRFYIEDSKKDNFIFREEDIKLW